jgi:D-alanine-D-alanine ligase
LRVTVLRGGPSEEREVSLASGAAVAEACRRIGHTVTEADIAPEDTSALNIPADVVFPVLHGTFGEDGRLQAMLEKRGLRFVGSDSRASALAMNKPEAKRIWHAAGLPTAPWVCVDAENLGQQGGRLQPPVVIKPAAQGSSIGVFFASTAQEMALRLAESVRRWKKVLVETRLVGRELTVGIVAGQPLPIIEIKTAVEFYDYQAKYARNDTEYVLDVDLPARDCREIQVIALRAFQAIGCRHYGRVDLIFDDRLGPQLLEVNTIPGFTDHSLLPKAAERVGMTFDALVGKLLSLAAGQ